MHALIRRLMWREKSCTYTNFCHIVYLRAEYRSTHSLENVLILSISFYVYQDIINEEQYYAHIYVFLMVSYVALNSLFNILLWF